MTDTPANSPRRPILRPTVESGIIPLLTNLRKNADRDTFDVLASGLNSYLTAMIRFGGRNSFRGKDIDRLLTIWQLMIEAGKEDVDFSPKAHVPEEVT